MADGKRPGGLTALAVLNFVFGGLGALGLLAIFAMFSAIDQASEGQFSKEAMSVGGGAVMVGLILGLISVVLLIASGVGYLGQKKFLGRTLGTAYGVLALISTVVSLVMLKQEFGIGNVIGLVYPILTLILVNTTFKEDLVN